MKYKDKTRLRKQWRVRIRVKDKTASTINNGGGRTRLIHVGTYKTKEAAIEARKTAELKYFGAILH
jgi:hypothetical protein